MNFGVTILIMNYFLGVESEMEHEWFISKKVRKSRERYSIKREKILENDEIAND